MAMLAAAVPVLSACPGSPHAPTPQTWVDYSVSPESTAQGEPGAVLHYTIRVVDKAIINADVQFEAESAPAGLRPVLREARIASTARDNELAVEIPPGIAAGTYQIELRARLFMNGAGAPDWYPKERTVRVGTVEAGFNLSCEPSQVTILPGRAVTQLVSALRSPGFTTGIDLSFDSVPDFLVVSPPTANLAPAVGGFAFVVSRHGIAAPPTYSLVAIGRAGGLERRCTVQITLPSS
jgi:hypothetical protein